MSHTLDNYFKFDLALAHKHGYRIGIPHASYKCTDAFGHCLSLLLVSTVNANDPSKGQLFINGTADDAKVSAAVCLTRVPSNLGTTGGKWYLICGVSGRRCRTLYFNGETMVARQALAGINYKCQHTARQNREFYKKVVPALQYRAMMEDWLSKPNAKKYYRNKPTPMTRRFLKLKDKLTSQ